MAICGRVASGEGPWAAAAIEDAALSLPCDRLASGEGTSDKRIDPGLAQASVDTGNACTCTALSKTNDAELGDLSWLDGFALLFALHVDVVCLGHSLGLLGGNRWRK